MIDTPPDLYGTDFAVTMTLRNAEGEAVQLPGPAGSPQPMRISQLVRAEEPQFGPEANVPRGLIWAHTQIIFNLSHGLPLPSGQLYSWRLDIDGREDERWAVDFFVPAHGPDLSSVDPLDRLTFPTSRDPEPRYAAEGGGRWCSGAGAP